MFAKISIILALAAGAVIGGCEERATLSPDAESGAQLIAAAGCGLCHEIPGIAGAEGRIGPPLDQVGRRVYIAGVIRNSPENLAGWIAHPQKYVPGNAMPEMGIKPDDARKMAAYLDTLR